MMGNPVLKDWRDERLAEIQSYERTVREHAEAIRMRAEKYEEPMRTECISLSIALKNMADWVSKRFASIDNGQP